jgi:excisionase family DNA binding protein
MSSTITPVALPPADAARFLAVSRRTLSRLIADRKVVARRCGRRTLVDRASLETYYESLPTGQQAPVRVR